MNKLSSFSEDNPHWIYKSLRAFSFLSRTLKVFPELMKGEIKEFKKNQRSKENVYSVLLHQPFNSN